MKIVFDPNKHCGAKVKQHNGESEYCRQRKGYKTDHLGTGRCYLHGGRSTSAKTEEGKMKKMEPKRLGLYSQRLTGSLKQSFDSCVEAGVEICNEDLYFFVQARLLEQITDKSIEPWSLADRKILRMAKTLMDEGDEDITEDYVEGLRQKLRGLTEMNVATIGNSLANMARSGALVTELANFRKRESLLLDMMLSILKAGSKGDREICLNTLRKCQVDAGLDIEKFNKILSMAVDEDEDEDVEAIAELEEPDQLPPGR
jgi:hypothetical protein